MREIYGTFEFSGDEIAKILYEELVRKGKNFPPSVGVQTSFHISGGRLEIATIKISEPIQGAKEL